MRIASVTGVYALMTILVSCSTSTPSRWPGKEMTWNQGPVVLKLKAKPNEKAVSRHYSHSKIRNFEGPQMVRERDEIVEFAISNHYKSVDKDSGRISYISTALEKDGVVELNDLAFPEVGQEIEFVVTPQAEVLKAGDYPETSVFFIPPVPLPKRPVEIGDTWSLKREWLGTKNSIPLRVEVVGILKEIRKCPDGPCALVEISGNVGVAGETTMAQFDSEVQGYFLFSIDQGEVLWSRVRSQESLNFPDSSVKVANCMTEVRTTFLPHTVPCKVDETAEGRAQKAVTSFKAPPR